MIEQRKSLGVVLEQRKSLGVVLEHWEVSCCVFEQFVIWYYILVKFSLKVQGGQDYFQFVEGTCIIACVLSFSVLFLLSAEQDSELTQTLNFFKLWTWEQFLNKREPKFLKHTIQPPLLVVFLTFNIHLHTRLILWKIHLPIMILLHLLLYLDFHSLELLCLVLVLHSIHTHQDILPLQSLQGLLLHLLVYMELPCLVLILHFIHTH